MSQAALIPIPEMKNTDNKKRAANHGSSFLLLHMKSSAHFLPK